MDSVRNSACISWLKVAKSESSSTDKHKAGWLVGLADRYAAIVLADSATFLLAVNRIAAFHSHSAITPNEINSSHGSVGRTSVP